MGKRNSFEYVKEYFRIVANPLIKIAFYDGNNRVQKVEQWKRIADNHLKNISFMGNGATQNLSGGKRLTQKDYIYAIKSCNFYLCKQYKEIEYLSKYGTAQNRKRVLGADSGVWNINRVNVGYIDEIICHLLKDE